MPSDHDNLVTRYDVAGRVQTIKKLYLKIVKRGKLTSFWAVSRLIKLKNYDFRPFLVNLVKIQNIPKCPPLTPPNTLISGPKKNKS